MPSGRKLKRSWELPGEDGGCSSVAQGGWRQVRAVWERAPGDSGENLLPVRPDGAGGHWPDPRDLPQTLLLWTLDLHCFLFLGPTGRAEYR